MAQRIKHPAQTTYFITWDKDWEFPHYGKVEPFQEMGSGRDKIYFDTDRTKVEKELEKFGILNPEL